MDELLKRIAINPQIMFGKPVIKGTRITVEHVVRELASGWTEDDQGTIVRPGTLQIGRKGW